MSIAAQVESNDEGRYTYLQFADLLERLLPSTGTGFGLRWLIPGSKMNTQK